MIVFEGVLSSFRHLAIDDGGIRVQGKPGKYVPFSQLRDAELDISVLGVALLRLIHRDGTRETLRIRMREALDAHAEILQHITAHTNTAALPDAARVALERGARPLGAWLEGLGHWARGDGYRSAAFDHEIAKAVLLDAGAPADVRAACVYTLLATGQEDDLAAVARAFALRALPPLVLVAARLGHGGAALVPDDMLLDVFDVLGADDVAHVKGALAASGHDDEAHVHDVMHRVKEVALREAVARRPPKRKAFHAHALGGYAAEQGVSRFK